MDRCLLEFGSDYLNFGKCDQPHQCYFDNGTVSLFRLKKTIDDSSLNCSVIGQKRNKTVNFSLKCGSVNDIICVKFSPGYDYLAVNRGPKSVEILKIVNKSQIDVLEFGLSVMQSCKSKNVDLMGFEWIGESELILLTTGGVEMYRITSTQQAKTLKLKSIFMKNINSSPKWYLYSTQCNLLLLSEGAYGHVFQLFQTTSTALTRLPKFEVDIAANPQPVRTVLFTKDVAIANVYNKTSVFVMRHNPRPVNAGAEVLVYQLTSDQSLWSKQAAQKTHILKLGSIGLFALHIIDNLVVVHKQVGQFSMVFDIAYPTDSKAGDSTLVHCPLFPPQAIGISPAADVFGDLSSQMYSQNWTLFQPNGVIDTSIGCIWFLQVNLPSVVPIFPDRFQLIDFLLRRQTAKDLLLNTIFDFILQKRLSLLEAQNIFNRINDILGKALTQGGEEIMITGTNRALCVLLDDSCCCLIIDQTDLTSKVFYPLLETDDCDLKYLVNILFEYLLSLSDHSIQPIALMYEVLINALVRSDQCEKLLQLMQYHVLFDVHAKPLAFLILSQAGKFTPALQCALDMLGKLQVASSEIIEILYDHGKIVDALRYAQHAGVALDLNDALKFLEKAQNEKNDFLFFTVYKYFEPRLTKRQISTDNFQKCVKYFNELVKNEECTDYWQEYKASELLNGFRSAEEMDGSISD